MKKILSLLLLVLAVTDVSAIIKPAIPFDASLERKVAEKVSSMSLDEKIGQMIQVEINIVTYSDPKYSVPSLMQMNRQQLDAVIKEFHLENKISTDVLVGPDGKADKTAFYPFYNLSQLINDLNPFRLDKDVLRRAFETYKIGSIQNMLGGLHGQDVGTWQRATTEIQKASMRYLGIPCIYGIDHLHGTNYVNGGTIFPQPIGMVATFNPELIHRIGEISAYETRAAGIPWTFDPDIDLGRHPAWSRQYEGMGEDPYLGSVMGTALMRGMQGNDPNHIDPYHVATTLKHYVAYGVTGNGIDRNPGTASEMDLREKYFAPFLSAIRAGALAVMTNSSVLNGMNGVANKRLLTDWLKKQLNWDGVIVTDWGDIENLRKRDHIVSTKEDGIIMAVNAGVDMMMVPSEWGYGALLRKAVDEGRVPMSRIDDAASRIIRMKYRLGLFDNPSVNPKLYKDFGSEKHAAVALQAALESEILLKNDRLPATSGDGLGKRLLPLSKGKKILVCGPNANTMRGLDGGWTYGWQGSHVEKYADGYHTILEAMQNEFGKENIIYSPGVEYDPDGDCEKEKAPRIDEAVEAAKDADYILACVGENSYAETSGNTTDLHLSTNQTELVKALAATGKPVILILNQGRCRLISDIVPLCGAIVDVMLPGNYGGDALAMLLSGRENFSGKLPVTYPSFPQAFTTYDYKVTEQQPTVAGIYNYEANAQAQWWFGTGLSYTKFKYTNLRVSRRNITATDSIEVSVDVTNIGSRKGKEVVMLFSSDLYASLVPDNRRLRSFRKIELTPGETKTVTFTLCGSDLAFVGADGHWILEKGDFNLSIGNLTEQISAISTYRWRTPNKD